MADHIDSEADLARHLKNFRKQFKKDHGRDPSRKDMNKHPAIAATYDAWLAIKSGSSSSASSSSTTTKATSKRKALEESPHRAAVKNSNADNTSVMLPPPTTPSKKKPRTGSSFAEGTNLFRTPTKKKGAGSRKRSPSVHDSGGSIVDVPSTPKQGIASPIVSRRGHTLHQSGGRTYESPSKLRDLLSSFSSIHRTPTKSTDKDSDAALMERLTGGMTTAYTPRTKARKRLRGEVVITPEKERGDQQQKRRDLQASQGIAQPGVKRRRGMATNTLKDYGIVSVAGPRSRAEDELARINGEEEKGRKSVVWMGGDQEEREKLEEDDREEEDDMLGPSPSVNRMTDRPVKSFRPLFGVEANGNLSDEEESLPAVEVEEDIKLKPKEGIPAKGGDVDDDDQDIVVVPYQRYGHFSQQPSTTLYSDDEDDDLRFHEAIASAAATRSIEQETRKNDEDDSSEEEAPSYLESLSLNSPQCKRARTFQRIKAGKQVRQLLGADSELQILDEWQDKTEEEAGKRKGGKGNPLAKSNKVGPAIKGGRLMKSAKNFEPVLSSKVSKAETNKKQKSSSLVFGNLREQLGSDQDSDFEDSDHDDAWASDVGSEEYGLGDGYMSEDIDA